MATMNLTGEYDRTADADLVPNDAYDSALVDVEDKVIELDTEKGKIQKVPMRFEVEVAGEKKLVKKLVSPNVKKGSTSQYNTDAFNLIEMAGLLPAFTAFVAGRVEVPDADIARWMKQNLEGLRYRITTYTVNEGQDTAYSGVEGIKRCLSVNGNAAPSPTA